MNIETVIKFIQKETPENERLLNEAFAVSCTMLEIEQNCIDQRISELLLERDYDKVTDYVKMSQIISETLSFVKSLGNKYELGRADTADKDIEMTNALAEDEMESDEKRINYDNFRVDENVAYNLMTDFRYMKPAAFSLDGVRYPARLWKLVLLKTCELLWEKNNSLFESFIADKFMQGKTRTYFSKDNEIMVKAEAIKGTEIFVETNLSANSIRDVIVKMLDKYRIPIAAYQIYLSKDLTPLHVEEIKSNTTEENEFNEIEDVLLDMQDICDDYDSKTEKCMNQNSPYFIMECCKQEKCSYINKSQYKNCSSKQEKGKIYVLPKRVLKKKQCPQCGDDMERTMFSVEFEDENELRSNNLYGCWCLNCSRAYITEGTHRSFVINKELEKIKVDFIKDEIGQLSLF